MNWQNVFYNLDTTQYSKEKLNKHYHRMLKRFHWRVWVTQDKRVIPMIYMRQSHLMATIKHVVRRLETFIANDDTDSFNKLKDSYWYLRDEAGRRGINLPVHQDIFWFGVDERIEERFFDDPHDWLVF